MRTPSSLLPDLPTLAARLTATLNPLGSPGQRPTIVSRVLCAFPNTPKYLGAFTDLRTGEAWLLLECLDESVRASDIPDPILHLPAIMPRVTRSIARFHAAHERNVASRDFSFLIRYDAEYFRGWIRRTREFAAPLFHRFPWLVDLCELTDQWLPALLAAPQTVIHGELYTKHVLLRQNRIYFVDWESAAIGAGEIDLATLTEGDKWPADISSRCERLYRSTRWPEGEPSGFERTLDAARMCLHFRWLGERPEWALREKSLWRYDHLHCAAERLGLI